MFLSCLFLCVGATHVSCQKYGPDPWNRPPPEVMRDVNQIQNTQNENTIAPKEWHPTIEHGVDKPIVKGDWFYKNILNVMLKRGHVQRSEDEVEILLNLRLSIEKWELLGKYAQSETPLTDDMFRRADGYISEAVRKPSLAEISVSWMEHLAHKLSYYKVEITYSLVALIIILACSYVPKYISRRHIAIGCFFFLYMWEAIISYKEAEKENYNAFVSQVQSCNWWSWWREDTGNCIMNIPVEDPLVLLKYMHPGRILMRLMSIVVTEPLLAFSTFINKVSTDISSELWGPFRPVVNGILQIAMNGMLIVMVIAILFNFVLNIPISFNFLGYIAGINFLSRPSGSSAVGATEHSNTRSIQGGGDRISGDNLKNLLNIITSNVSSPKPLDLKTNQVNTLKPEVKIPNALKRSASTGRLTYMSKYGGGDSWVDRGINDKNC